MTIPRNEPGQRIDNALMIAGQYGQIEGGHHRQWVIDQMVRALLESHYEEWIESYLENGEYWWETGIAP